MDTRCLLGPPARIVRALRPAAVRPPAVLRPPAARPGCGDYLPSDVLGGRGGRRHDCYIRVTVCGRQTRQAGVSLPPSTPKNKWDSESVVNVPHRTEYETQRETLKQRVDDREIGEKTAAAIEELCDALDPEVDRVPLPDGENHRAVKTLDMYTRRLRLIAERFDGDLTATRADTLNEEMQRWYDGRHPDVGNDGVTRNTISNYQGPLRVFYRYHDFGIDPDDIDITAPESSPIDSDDMLADEELQEIRNYIDSSRDHMIFELLLNTGLRNTAARTIRLTNLELEDGAFHLNEEADGLKGAAIRGTKRPLLGAEPSVRQWLSDHPTPGNPDAYLITNEQDSPHLDPTSPVSHTHLGTVLRDIKDGADVDKPLHPHALRHNFVTRAKRDHEMDDATIKYLIGHPANSSVMERTYQHISAETHVEDARESAGGVAPLVDGGLHRRSVLAVGRLSNLATSLVRLVVRSIHLWTHSEASVSRPLRQMLPRRC